MPARVLTRVSVVAAAALIPTLMPVAASADSDTMADQMHRLRVCESSDNYRTNTGNGYYGAYQFDLRTWHGLGYSGRPDQAADKTQDDATIKLHHERGWKPWPECSRKEHLH